MTTKRAIALAAIVCTFALGTALAQKKDKREDTNTRTVQGVVLDNGDNPVVGAVVQLKDTKTLQIRSFITQEKGEYHFAGLSTNIDYELKADHDGATSGSKNLSVFDNRKLVTMNLKLK